MAKKKSKVSKKAKAKKGRAKPRKKAKAAKKVFRKAAKKPARKALRPAAKAAKRPIAKPAAKPVQRTKLGEVIHYYTHISVAVVKVETSLKVGDVISIEGATTNVKQRIDSMQIDHDQVTEAKKGQEVGMKVAERVREGDAVYKA